MTVSKTSAQTPADLAKGALRRLAQARLEPTPENYTRAYAAESGRAPAPAAAPEAPGLPPALRPLLERLVIRSVDDGAQRGELVSLLMGGRFDEGRRALDRGLAGSGEALPGWSDTLGRLLQAVERGGRQWTVARRKESVRRLLGAQRQAAPRVLQQQIDQLLVNWERDQPDAAPEQIEPAPTSGPGQAPAGADEQRSRAVTDAAPADATAAVGAMATDAASRLGAADAAQPAPPAESPSGHQVAIIGTLEGTVRFGLPRGEPRARELAEELAVLGARIQREGATVALAEAVAEVCLRARRLLGLRHEMVNELMGLTRDLTAGITELAEDGSWAKGQGAAVRQRLDGTPSSRTVRAARLLLNHTREAQRGLAEQRQQARDALRQLVSAMLAELGQLDAATGGFSDRVQGYAKVIESAESLESLGAVVRELVSDSRTVHDVVSSARNRLASEHARAAELEGKVRELESELRRLSDEVSTDALTQVANRRGLSKAFEIERERADREGAAAAPLSIGLIDIDNFKKLNDTLGHAAGDVALKCLAERVKGWLRPVDHIARFGGEEFVVLLPDTPVQEAQQALTRLQQHLSSSLFVHDGKEVFVTFSAGVSAYRVGEALEAALERSDEALYEAKRTGKNRTCMA